jgi:hypothetical protein
MTTMTTCSSCCRVDRWPLTSQLTSPLLGAMSGICSILSNPYIKSMLTSCIVFIVPFGAWVVCATLRGVYLPVGLSWSNCTHNVPRVTSRHWPCCISASHENAPSQSLNVQCYFSLHYTCIITSSQVVYSNSEVYLLKNERGCYRMQLSSKFKILKYLPGFFNLLAFKIVKMYFKCRLDLDC